jgi:hypothetical protein
VNALDVDRVLVKIANFGNNMQNHRKTYMYLVGYLHTNSGTVLRRKS